VAELIMPEGAKSIRQLAHNTCVEVLLYMSPNHAQFIIDSVATNLNSTYLRFMRRSPRYSGKVSILAYSLGSILCYDLLAHQTMPESHPAAFQLQKLVELQHRSLRAQRAATGRCSASGQKVSHGALCLLLEASSLMLALM
jgi:hypothetical protein